MWLGKDRLIVVGEDGNEGLFILTVAAAPTVTPIGSPGLGQPGAAPHRPSVSPDGNSIAYVQGDVVWRIGVDGSGLQQLTLAKVGATWPTWSPDGSQIALVDFDVCGGFKTPDVMVISAASTNQDLTQATRVTRNNGASVRSCGPIYWLP